MEDATQDPPRKTQFPQWAIWLSLLLLVFVGFIVAEYFRPPWGWISKSIEETLHSPTGVHSWTKEGLTLADGRQISLPDVKSLPATNSPLLCEATKQGVEISSNGRIFGLLRIHHWCGNDPVHRHIAKVDLSRLLLFTGDAEPIKQFSRDTKECLLSGTSLGNYGWRVDEFFQFQSWNTLVDRGVIKLFQE